MKIDSKKKNKFISITRSYFPLSLLLFFCFFLFGVLFSSLYPALAGKEFKEIQETLSLLFNLGPIEMALFIFFNNSIKILIAILLGVLFAVPTIFFLILNGWALGYVSGLIYPDIGLTGLFYSLFFHGIFELTALFIGTSLGFWIGVSIYREIKERGETLSQSIMLTINIFFREKIAFVMDVFFYVIVPLLAVAAVIETYLIFFL